MADQTARCRARRAVLEARARRAERAKRRNAPGLEVAAALAERDAVTAACEARAGQPLVKLTDQEGLGFAEAIEWCGAESLTARESASLCHSARWRSEPWRARVAPAVRGRGRSRGNVEVMADARSCR